MDLDFFKSNNFDYSLIINCPKNFSSILDAAIAILNSKGKLVEDLGDVDVSEARRVVEQATGDLDVFYLVRNPSNKVWDILTPAIEDDRIRVLGIFTGVMPQYLPANKILVDVSRSMSMIPKRAISVASDLVSGKSRKVGNNPEEINEAIQLLCYEALYSPDVALFNRKLASRVPRAIAFNYLYTPIDSPNSTKYLAKILEFVDSVVS